MRGLRRRCGAVACERGDKPDVAPTPPAEYILGAAARFAGATRAAEGERRGDKPVVAPTPPDAYILGAARATGAARGDRRRGDLLGDRLLGRGDDALEYLLGDTCPRARAFKNSI